MAEKSLQSNIEYVEKQKKELLKEYRDKFLLVYNQKIVSSFDSYNHAAEEGVRLFGAKGNFLVYQILEQEPVNFIMEAAL